MSCFRGCFTWKQSAQPNTECYTDLTTVRKIKVYSYKELQRATKDFSIYNKVGEGGFGSVYKGTLRDGTAVAVKVLGRTSKHGVSAFLTELNVIADIAHENLVKFYGCCTEADHRILVYHYLKNNSLAEALFGSRNAKLHLNWRNRVKIAVGVARGLAYLHEDVQPHIVHRDVKASNVLLDDDFTPKISDFGLAKLFPVEASHLTTRVAGTLGYLAPEYAVRGQVTRKADVYSFGVLLLEIVSGRPNTDTGLAYDDQILLEKVWTSYESGELEKIVDSSLTDVDMAQARRFMKVGLLCTQEVPKLRPNMAATALMLAGEVDVDNVNIVKPAVISDLMDLKVGLADEKGRPVGILSIVSSATYHSSAIMSDDPQTSDWE